MEKKKRKEQESKVKKNPMNIVIKYRKNLHNAMIFFLLLAVEFIIARHVHDRFFRPYVGDVLVVMVLYFAIRSISVWKVRMLPLWIFLFAAGVESLQYVQIADLLGAKKYPILRIIVGATFDVKDIVCYGIGCILLGVYEVLRRRKHNEVTKNLTK